MGKKTNISANKLSNMRITHAVCRTDDARIANVLSHVWIVNKTNDATFERRVIPYLFIVKNRTANKTSFATTCNIQQFLNKKKKIYISVLLRPVYNIRCCTKQLGHGYGYKWRPS